MLSRTIKRFFGTIQPQCSLNKLSGEFTGVSVIELNNPQSRNALSSQMVSEMRGIIDYLKTDRETRVAILRSAIPSMFCAGADLKARLQLTNEQTEDLVNNLRDTFNQFSKLPFPTIASIDGAALGGGLEIALACDLRVASESSILGLPECALAIIPGAGGTQRLSRVVGLAKAKELVFTSARLRAEEAKEIGLVNYVEADFESAYDRSLQLSKKIIRNGPLGIAAAKCAMDQGFDTDIKTGLEIERLNYQRVCYSNDRYEGLLSFVEKRRPIYKGN